MAMVEPHKTQAPGPVAWPTGNTGIQYGRVVCSGGQLRDKVDARRLAAIINHQGPPIPARVLSEGGRHRVLAGPFDNRRAARDAAKRLKIDLELDGLLFET
jgi:cell division septation protein DedD